MPQFVVLEHDWPEPHFDLLLENGASLLAFRLPKLPDEAGCVPVRRLFDHRLIYLTYEGEVPGGKGRVVRRMAGDWRLVEQTGGLWLLELQTATRRWSARLEGAAAGWLSPIRGPGQATREGGCGELWLSPWTAPRPAGGEREP